jgi:hypothetical protein
MVELKESPFPPEVKITLDKERVLKFPVPSIWAFEDLTGIDITGAGIRDEEEFYGGTKDQPATLRQRLNRVIDLIWAGLLDDDPEIKREFVAKFVYLRDIQRLDELCAKAFFAALVSPKAEGENSGPLAEKPSHSAASKSGRSRVKTSE